MNRKIYGPQISSTVSIHSLSLSLGQKNLSHHPAASRVQPIREIGNMN